ncbi:putative dispersed gene family protein 1 (DGF-1) [Trypanosoma cruzi]|nr:putative dispersed gene family protein 1 (DGF-1) [Trypanosoma cruzi]
MSGSVRNVTLANCAFVDGASLYVVGWLSDPPAGERADVLISGLESCSGGGVLVANRYPPGSRVTVVDSVLIAEKRVAYRGAYFLGDASACLVVHSVNLTGSVLTIARTHVAAAWRCHRAVRSTWTGCRCRRRWGCACRWRAVLRPAAAPWWRLLTATSCYADTRCLCAGL